MVLFSGAEMGKREGFKVSFFAQFCTSYSHRHRAIPFSVLFSATAENIRLI